MRIKLTDVVHVPDENHEGEGEPARATNYPGAVLDVSDAFGAECIALGKAIEVTEPTAEPAGETAAAVQQHFETQE